MPVPMTATMICAVSLMESVYHTRPLRNGSAGSREYAASSVCFLGGWRSKPLKAGQTGGHNIPAVADRSSKLRPRQTKTLKKKRRKSLRKTDRDFRPRGVPVDWEANYARSQRLEKIVDSSALERRDIARHIGISLEHLSRVLRSKTVHLGPRMEEKIKQAVRVLMRQTRIEVNRCMRLKVVESRKDTARAERIDRIIRTSRVKRGDIARQAGISLAHLSTLLRAKSRRLGPKLERKIEQAINDLQRDRYFATYRSLHSQVESDGNDARVERINRIIQRSHIDREDIAQEAGITPFHLSRLLRAKTTSLGGELERRIEQAVWDLVRRTRSKTRRCMRLNAAESLQNLARVERANRIIQTSKVSQREVAGRVGISLSLFHHVLRKKDVRLRPELEARIEQAVHDLLSEAQAETNRLLGASS